MLERNAEHASLLLDNNEQDEDLMQQLQGYSVTYRIAIGPNHGRKVFTLHTLLTNSRQ